MGDQRRTRNSGSTCPPIRRTGQRLARKLEKEKPTIHAVKSTLASSVKSKRHRRRRPEQKRSHSKPTASASHEEKLTKAEGPEPKKGGLNCRTEKTQAARNKARSMIWKSAAHIPCYNRLQVISYPSNTSPIPG